jgi:hypothetical protein
MAVKVMVAPAIANGELTRKPVAHKAPAARKQAEPRPKRRRSAVYDSEGNEVFITLICLKCQKIRPLSQFGLRKMADGSIRNQPWCRTCRSGTSAKADEESKVALEGATAGESPNSGESPLAEPSSPAPEGQPADPLAAKPPERRRPGAVAAEVAAALMAGRG